MKVPLLSSTAFLYILFFSNELDSRMALGARWQCDGASVSMTRTLNNASTCGCQTPLIPRSSLSPGSVIAINNTVPHEIMMSIGVTCVVVITVCIIVYERVKNMCRKVPVQGVEGERKPLLNADYVNSYREPLLDDS